MFCIFCLWSVHVVLEITLTPHMCPVCVCVVYVAMCRRMKDNDVSSVYVSACCVVMKQEHMITMCVLFVCLPVVL
jgi:hypothetical protein